ncbi:MAG: response regulator transcription factor [Acidobacteria bacterium]|nr:response regulator transcription factor [Acidobacteriota bacterium]MCB9399159.1 response regulator transcription factor [Acidobacteriota bacterium]
MVESVAPAPKRILMIEDDASIRLLLGFGLRRAGYQVEMAENGALAKEHFQAFTPDLILLDLYMPYFDGLSFLKWVRQDVGSKVPIIVISAAEKEIETAQKEGADAFLAKPVDIAELVACIEHNLNHEAV